MNWLYLFLNANVLIYFEKRKKLQDYLDVYKKITTLAKNFEDEKSFICHIPRIWPQ